MPKVRDVETGEVFEVPWKERRDPTQEEMQALIDQAKANRSSSVLPKEESTLGKIADFSMQPIEPLRRGIEAITPENKFGKAALTGVLSAANLPGSLMSTGKGIYEALAGNKPIQQIEPSELTPTPLDIVGALTPAAGASGSLGTVGRIASGTGALMTGAGSLAEAQRGNYGKAALYAAMAELGRRGAKLPKAVPEASNLPEWLQKSEGELPPFEEAGLKSIDDTTGFTKLETGEAFDALRKAKGYEKPPLGVNQPIRDPKTGKMLPMKKKVSGKGPKEKGEDFELPSEGQSGLSRSPEVQQIHKLFSSFSRLADEKLRAYQPDMEGLIPELGKAAGRYKGKLNKLENTGKFEYNPVKLAQEVDSATEFADILADVYAHENAHLFGPHPRPKGGNVMLSGGGQAEVGPEFAGRFKSSNELMAQVSPGAHGFQTSQQVIENTPEFNKLRDLLRKRITPEMFKKIKNQGSILDESVSDFGMPKGEWTPEAVVAAAKESGGKGIKTSGNKISWTAADGEQKSVEIGVDRIGQRTFGLNPRAQGLAQRQIGTNPRSPLPGAVGENAPEPPFTKETGALLVGPRNPNLPPRVPPRKATVGERVSDVANISRTLKSSIDLSMPLRQAGLFTARHPAMAAKASVKMLKAYGSERYYEDFITDLHLRPNFVNSRYNKAGLALTLHGKHTGLLNREEAFLSTIPERIPLLGKLVSGSNRAAVTFLNQTRADMFDHLADKYAKVGVPDNDIAKFVNIITGRAGLGKLGERIQPVLQTMLFSPRFLASRIQSITHMVPGTGLLHPSMQKELGGAWAAYAAAIGAALGAAKLAGAKVEFNSKSSDYLKISFGKTHIDIGGSYPQLATFFSQLISGKRKDIRTGREEEIGRGRSSEIGKRAGTVGRFLRSKLNPPVGLAVTALSDRKKFGKGGSNYIGQPFDSSNPWHWAREGVQLHTPMYPSDLFSSIKEHGVAKGAAVSIPSLIGGNVNIYNPRERGKDTFKKDVMDLWNSRLGRALREK